MTTPLPSPAASPDVAALSSLVAVEDGAVYACSAAGGALAGAAGDDAARVRDLARTAYDAHRRARDLLTARITDRGGTPPAAEPAYALPVAPAGTAAGAARLLAVVEDRAAQAAYDALATLTVTPLRDTVAALLADAAVRGWRARVAGGAAPGTAAPVLPGT